MVCMSLPYTLVWAKGRRSFTQVGGCARVGDQTRAVLLTSINGIIAASGAAQPGAAFISHASCNAFFAESCERRESGG